MALRWPFDYLSLKWSNLRRGIKLIKESLSMFTRLAQSVINCPVCGCSQEREWYDYRPSNPTPSLQSVGRPVPYNIIFKALKYYSDPFFGGDGKEYCSAVCFSTRKTYKEA